MAARFEAEKFTWKNDFGLWRLKMRAMLIQQDLGEVIKVDDGKEADAAVIDDKTRVKRKEMQQRAHSAVILCLGDKVLQEVAKEETAAGILKKLEGLYMTKSLANRLYMKQRLYSYKFLEDRKISKQIEDFNKAIDDLENIDVSIADEDKAIMLLNALPKSFDQLRDAMLYGRERTITPVEVQSALQAKELQKGETKGGHDQVAASLNIKKFKGKKPQKKKYNESVAEGADQKETRSCHWCKKPGHLKKDCFAWKRKQSMNPQQNTVSCVEEVDAPEILNVMESGDEAFWIMDSGCSFHICPRREWFEELTDSDGSVVLGNN